MPPSAVCGRHHTIWLNRRGVRYVPPSAGRGLAPDARFASWRLGEVFISVSNYIRIILHRVFILHRGHPHVLFEYLYKSAL